MYHPLKHCLPGFALQSLSEATSKGQLKHSEVSLFQRQPRIQFHTLSFPSATTDKITHLHHTGNTKCSPGAQNNRLPFLYKYLKVRLLPHFSLNKKQPF